MLTKRNMTLDFLADVPYRRVEKHLVPFET